MTSSDLAVRVRAPSRLHFGLLAFGDTSSRQFGGVGVMIDRPENEAIFRLRQPGDLPSGPSCAVAARAREFAQRFCEHLDSDDDRARISWLEIQVLKSAAQHVGLGSGTQLAMSVARALAAFVGQSDMPPQELARRVGRGGRSAIGVHGFQLGGFIVEGGKSDPTSIAPLVARLNFPDDWHFILIILTALQGRHGHAEREAFEQLGPVTTSVTSDLCRLTLLGLLPAVAERDFRLFSESLLEFGCKVGKLFSAIQGGVYASPLARDVIELLNRHGIRGIAQSSWGPTLCAVTDSRFRAEWIAARLTDSLPATTAQVICTSANNCGAVIEVVRTASQ